MSQPPLADLPARTWILAAVTLLVLVFPCLMAGRGIDAKASQDELARLALALEDPDGEQGGPAVLFYGATLPGRASSDGVGGLEKYVPVARLSSILGILCATVLLYLSVMLARGRTHALIACMCFGLLPAVAVEGYVLRPEIPVSVFGLLGLIVLQSLPMRLASRQRRAIALRAALASANALVIGMAFAFAAVSLSWYGIYLVIPGACLLLVILLVGYRFIRAVRRMPAVIPLIPMFVRVVPWLVIAVFSLVMMAAVFAVVSPNTEVTILDSGLLPEGKLASATVIALALLGGVSWTVRAGMVMGRWRRLTAEVVLLVFCVILLLQRRLLPEGADALPAAGPLAVMVAEGALVVMVFAKSWISGRSLRSSSS